MEEWSKNLHHAGSYLSLDDIIATSERLPCRFRVSVPKLGCINPTANTNTIEANSKMPLPLWLAKSLCSNRRQVIEADLPLAFKSRYREIFNADATVVDLHKIMPFFYLVGCHLQDLPHAELPEMTSTLLKIFQNRLRMVTECALNTSGGVSTSRMDELELSLYRSGRQSSDHVRKWCSRQLDRIEATQLVQRHHKRRKLADLQTNSLE